MNDKKWIKFRMFIWSLIAVLLSIFLIFNVFSWGGSYFNNNIMNWGFSTNNNMKKINEYEFDDIDSIKNITTNINNSDVVLGKNNKDNIKVIVKSNKGIKDKNSIKADKNLDTVSIEDKSNNTKGKFFGITKGIFMEVEVLIPDSYKGNLNIDNNVGDLSFVSSLEFHNVDINVKTGDVDINQKLIANKLVINNKVGDLDAKTLIVKDLSIEGKTGDIEIEELEGKGSLDSDVGDIDCGIEKLSGDLKLRSRVGDVDISINRDLSFLFEGNKKMGEIESDLEFNNVSQSSKHFSGKYGKTPNNLISVDVKTGDIGIYQK
ncbi:MAG: DUF4097 family beta strand repeat-containing protein [Terrisporobacter sp.]